MALEIELKLAVTVEDLELLRLYLPAPVGVRELTNIYFDTPDRKLEATKRMLRLRLREGSVGGVLCYKGPSVHEEGVFRAEELEWSLSAEEVAAFLEDPGTQGERLSGVFPGISLHLLGRFGDIRVRRTVYIFEGDLALEMDHVRYSDGSQDAELEVEAEQSRMDEVRHFLERVIERAGITATPQTRTKYQRFLERI